MPRLVKILKMPRDMRKLRRGLLLNITGMGRDFDPIPIMK